MSEGKNEMSWGFSNELFPDCAHMCLIFDSEEQRRKIVSQYLDAGFRQGEFVRYLTDKTSPEDVRSWLLEMGVELPEAGGSGSFGIFKADSVYCPNGHFDPREMIKGMLLSYDKAKKGGYRGTRSCGEMTWALKGIPGSDRLFEYEALISTITETYPHKGMCMYDARLFDGATLLNVLKVHPYMVAQEQIVRNPFYVRPEEFLEELKSSQ